MTATKESRELAVQCWNDQRTRGKVIDPDLAEVFAEALDKAKDKEGGQTINIITGRGTMAPSEDIMRGHTVAPSLDAITTSDKPEGSPRPEPKKTIYVSPGSPKEVRNKFRRSIDMQMAIDILHLGDSIVLEESSFDVDEIDPLAGSRQYLQSKGASWLIRVNRNSL